MKADALTDISSPLSRYKRSPQPIKTNCRFLWVVYQRAHVESLAAIFWYFLSRKSWYMIVEGLQMQKFPLRMLSHFRIAERKKEKKKLQETMTQSEGWAPLQEKGVRVLLTGLFLQDATEARVWRAVTFTLCSAKEKKRKRQRWEWSCSSLSPASPYITGRVSRLFCCVIRYFRTPGEEMDGAVDLMWR